ncbi:MAG: hypothetical protein QNJ65_12030 [Xenococcaceae cyanobacterium MO_234.B1]|nr:hypothetical protein [Xenococcaceae cyanobacterium MO_234.B1]
MDWLVITAVTVVGAFLGIGISLFWDDIREQVAAWLRRKGWEKSVLMDAWIKLDRFIGFVRCRIFVKTQKKSKVKISEQEYAIDEIDDPDVLEELQRKGHVKKNIMTLIQ